MSNSKLSIPLCPGESFIEGFNVKCIPKKEAVISSDHIDDDDSSRREVKFLVMRPTLADQNYLNSEKILCDIGKSKKMELQSPWNLLKEIWKNIPENFKNHFFPTVHVGEIYLVTMVEHSKCVRGDVLLNRLPAHRNYFFSQSHDCDRRSFYSVGPLFRVDDNCLLLKIFLNCVYNIANIIGCFGGRFPKKELNQNFSTFYAMSSWVLFGEHFWAHLLDFWAFVCLGGKFFNNSPKCFFIAGDISKLLILKLVSETDTQTVICACRLLRGVSDSGVWLRWELLGCTPGMPWLFWTAVEQCPKKKWRKTEMRRMQDDHSSPALSIERDPAVLYALRKGPIRK